MKLFRLLAFVFLLPLTVSADCTLTNLGIKALPDLGFETYKNFPGGLYPNFANQPPPAHLAAGVNIAQSQIKPLDASGSVDTNNGKIVLIALGLSNTTQEWATKGSSNFTRIATNDPSLNPRVQIVDGAIGGEDAPQWTNVNAPDWSFIITQRLVQASVTTNQVQVAWLKQALAHPLNFGEFPLHAQELQKDVAQILRVAKIKFPNLKLVYLSPRTRAYLTTSNALNPEPFAFETAFGDKWVIEDQITGQNNLNFNPTNGPVVAPWIAWGPYIWTDGAAGRSDGLTSICPDDLENDFTHPSPIGVAKVAQQLLAFFKTDPTTTPWFLRQTVVGQAPNCTLSADVTNGVAPLTVQFIAAASDPDGSIRDYQWTFDDGTFSTSANPTKIFKAPGIYIARLTVADNSGNAVPRSLTLTVKAVALGNPKLNGNQFQFSIFGATNLDFVVQRADHLTNWLPVVTNRGPFIFSETNVLLPQRFYRAVIQP